jgi:hypothetical protein
MSVSKSVGKLSYAIKTPWTSVLLHTKVATGQGIIVAKWRSAGGAFNFLLC